MDNSGEHAIDTNEIQTEPHALHEYMTDPRVVSSYLQFLGGTGSSWTTTNTITAEFLGVGTIEKAFNPVKHSPISTLQPEEVQEKIRTQDGKVELYSSFLQKPSVEEPGVPKRVLFHWDLDRFI